MPAPLKASASQPAIPKPKPADVRFHPYAIPPPKPKPKPADTRFHPYAFPAVSKPAPVRARPLGPPPPKPAARAAGAPRGDTKMATHYI